MKWLALVRMAFGSIWHHKLRSMLTALGVVFGVGAVVAMLAISEGARGEALRAIESMGLQNVVVRSVKPSASAVSNAGTNSTVLNYGVTDADQRRLSGLPGVRDAVPTSSVRIKVFSGSRRIEARVVASVPAYAEVAVLGIDRGRFLVDTDQTERRPVCVLGSVVARDLFGFEDPMGAQVRIGEEWFRVIGILAPKRDAAPAMGLAAADFNRTIYLPQATQRARFGMTSVIREAGSFSAERVEISALVMRFEPEVDVLAAGSMVRRVMTSRHDQADVDVVVPLELLEQRRRTQRIFTIVMGSIAGISLLVGGIGIMNIMLASVLERTREIGIRRAVGARRGDVVWQFLVEAVVLCAGGGVLGAAAGVGGAVLVSTFAGWPTAVTWWSLSLAMGIAALVGVVFGCYPAIRAARMEPVEALRNE